MNIQIIGAGIGGLALAATLARLGIEFSIFEQSTGLRATGYGLTVQKNALQALDCIGLGKELRQAGQMIRHGQIVTSGGSVLTELDAELCAIHRGALQAVLASVVPESCFHFGERVESPAADAWTVAADGVHSALRKHVAPTDTAVRDSGCTAWRGLVPPGVVSLTEEEKSLAIEAWGRGKRFGLVPLEGGQIYWFAVTRVDPFSPGDAARMKTYLQDQFGEWLAPIGKLLQATPSEAILQTRITDRLPLASWHKDQLILLGDAAHPMTPNLGQGGCQAIEDGVVLGHLFAEVDAGRLSEAELGNRFQTLRKARVNHVGAQSYLMGRLANVRNPLLAFLRNQTIRWTPPRIQERSMDEILNFPGPLANWR